MTDNADSRLSSTPPLEPPNGHAVSNAELYKALFTLDQRLGERDTALINMVGTLRTDFSIHTKDGHPWNQQAETLQEAAKAEQEKSKVSGKKYGALAATAGLLTLVASGISAVLDKWVY